MDINDQLQPIVQTLITELKGSIEQEVRDKATQEIVAKLASSELSTLVDQLITKNLEAKIAKLDFESMAKKELDRLVYQINTKVNTSMTATANESVVKEINKQVAQLNIHELIRTVIHNKITTMVDAGSFPDNTIPHKSVNFKGLTLSGNQVEGGIIKQFGSTGIEDRASHVQVTLMDHATAFEGPVWAPEIQVKGSLIVDGNIKLAGNLINDSVLNSLVDKSIQCVRESLNTELFQGYSNMVSDNIRLQGLDLNKITLNGKDVVMGNQLGYSIVDSNLQRLGLVKDLQTKGEAYFSETLYVTEGRVGVGTMDPSATFVVWDEEVEMVVTKHSQDTGYIGAPRYQKLVLGANNKDNLTLNTDGSVQVNDLRIGKLKITHSDSIPNYPGQVGDIVFYAYPTIGGPIGWVCLGNTRWAKFGIITD